MEGAPASSDDRPSDRRRLLDFAVRGTEDDARNSKTVAIPSQLPNPEVELSVIRDKHHLMIGLLLANQEVYEAVQLAAYRHVQERFRENLFTNQYQPAWLKPDARRVFYDIETLQLPNDDEVESLYPTGSTNYYTKQRLGTCVSIDDAGKVECWDEQNVRQLKEYLLSFDEIVSFNGLRFDNYILQGYRGAPNEAQELVNRSLDVMLLLEFLEGQRRSLDFFSKKYLGRGKLDRGGKSEQVPKTLREGDPEQIAWIWKYCYWDVLLLRDLYEAIPINRSKKVGFYSGMVQLIEREVAEATKSVLQLSTYSDPVPSSPRLRRTGMSAGREKREESLHEDLQLLISEVCELVRRKPDEAFEYFKHVMVHHKDERPIYYERDDLHAFTTAAAALLDEALHEARTSEDISDTGVFRHLLTPNLAGLSQQFANALCTNDMRKASIAIKTLHFINKKFLFERRLWTLKLLELKSLHAAVIGDGSYVLAEKINKGNFEKIKKSAGANFKKVLAFTVSPGGLEDVQRLEFADQVGTLDVLNLRETGLITGDVDAEKLQVCEHFRQELKKHLTSRLAVFLREQRRSLAAKKLEQCKAQLARYDRLKIPIASESMPSWLRELMGERQKLEEAKLYLSAVVEGAQLPIVQLNPENPLGH